MAGDVSRAAVKLLDKSSMAESMGNFGQQCQQGWMAGKSLEMEKEVIDKVLIAGMGGSGLGGKIITDSLGKELRLPVFVWQDYGLPNWVDRKSLVILSSYSGETEETLSAAEEAKKRGLQIAIVTSGGKLADWAKKNGLPRYVFEPTLNICKQPRTGMGYSLGFLLGLMVKIGALTITDDEFASAMIETESNLARWQPEGEENNMAKLMGVKLSGKTIITVAAEHMTGTSRVFGNFVNENAKSIAFPYQVPEANHNLIEFLGGEIGTGTAVVFWLSGNYSPIVIKRMTITKKMFEEKGIETMALGVETKEKLGEILSSIVLGQFIPFYMAINNHFDPTPIPEIVNFKMSLN